LQQYCEGVDHFSPSISVGSITRGENVVNAYKKIVMLLILHTNKYLKLLRATI